MIRKFFAFIFFVMLIGLAVCGFFTYKYFELKKEVAKNNTSTTSISYKLN